MCLSFELLTHVAKHQTLKELNNKVQAEEEEEEEEEEVFYFNVLKREDF